MAKKTLNTEKILYEVINAISVLDIDEMLLKIDIIVTKLTDADSTGIYTLDHTSQSVILRASKLHSTLVNKLKMEIGEGITGWVAKFGKTVVITKDASFDARFFRVIGLPDDLYQAFLSVPIKSGDVIVGVINVKHKESHQYPMEEVQLLEVIGKLIGKALEHAELLEKTKNLEEALATQKAVNKAKGILMAEKNLSENDAYHLIRKQAMKERKTMKEVAESILTTKFLFDKD